jgi:DNA-binding MarR family transcriptional regulator
MDDRLLFLMSKAQHALKNYLKKEFSNGGIDISPAQAGILFSLKISNGLSMNHLSRIISIDNAAITRHIDTLERDGLVKRDPDANDRRKNIISITDKGIIEADRTKAIARRINSMIKEGFSDEEIEVFKKVLSSFLIKFKQQ